jgi:hypothetical protein
MSEVERTINRLKNLRAVATRYDKRANVFHGTVTVAAIWLWRRPCSAGWNLAVGRSKTSGAAPLCAITVLPNHVV